MVTYDAVNLLPYFSFIDSSNNIFRYSENSYHRPIFGSGINPSAVEAGTILYNFANATPRKGREFSEIELPVSLDDIAGLTDLAPAINCIRLQKSVGKPKPLMIYGWVDSIEPISTKGPSKNTLIRFHVDYWLTEQYYTWFANTYTTGWQRSPITFKNGRVKRGPDNMARPDPSTPRQWIYDGQEFVIKSETLQNEWVVFLYTKTTVGSDNVPVTKIMLGFSSSYLNSGAIRGITDKEAYGGELEELTGIDSNDFIGVWICPVMPKSNSSVVDHQAPAYLGGYTYRYREVDLYWGLDRHTFTTSDIMTTDNEKYVLMDATDTAVYTLPWGIKVNTFRIIPDFSAMGGFLDISIGYDDGLFPSTTFDNNGEGLRCQIPLPTVPITANAMSSYVLSGQQDYDRTAARIQQETNLKSGIAGSANSAVTGLLGGALTGNVYGAIGGAAVGAGLGIASAYMQNNIQREADAKSQQNLENLMANQAAGLAVSGGGSAWKNIAGNWQLIKMVRDGESAAELADEQSELGYVTDAFTTDAASLINAGGPLRIEGLQVDGDITPAGRANIQALFARGVHLDLIQ